MEVAELGRFEKFKKQKQPKALTDEERKEQLRLERMLRGEPEPQRSGGFLAPSGREYSPSELAALRVQELMQTPEGIAQLTKELDRSLARQCFAEFFRQAWKVMEPSTELVWNWHLSLMCAVAQAVIFDWLRTKREPDHINKCRKVLINVPPGSSKSKVFAVALQAFIWLHWPGFRSICLSVNEDSAMRDARATRELILSPWFQDLGPRQRDRRGNESTWAIKGDQNAISNFGNTAGGERLSMPSRSVVVGIRGDGIFIDDPNDPSENMKERAEVNMIWDTTQANRVNDLQRSLKFGIQQRTGSGDWSEHVIEKEGAWSPENPSGWLQVVIPAEFEAARRFVMPEYLANLVRDQIPPEYLVLADPRTKEGQTIDEKRMPREVLEAERRRWAGTGNFVAQMQQRPAIIEGARVKRDYWGFFRLEGGVRADVDGLETSRPRPAHCHPREKMAAELVEAAFQRHGHWDFDWITLSLDCAAKKTERGSQWGILFAAGKGGRRYILDDLTQRGDILEIVEVLRTGIKRWQPDTILIEDKAAGEELRKRLLHEMTKGEMPMIELVLLKPSLGGEGREQGKEQRLDACLPVIANGLVSLLDGAPWLEEFVEELGLFPHGKNSDRVDALTQILNHYVEFEGDQWPSFN